MTLQTSGAISLANIQTEFGGSNPISLSEYYGMGGVTGSGQISIGNFYGTSAGIASYTYSNTRDDIMTSASVYSDTKTFPTAVASGSTSISVTGNVYNEYNNSHTAYTANGLWMYDVRFQVKLYSGSTLLHTTAWSSYYPHGSMSKTWTTTVSQPITKAILYRQNNQPTSGTPFCHSRCVNSITIG
jgi:alpha-glucuronidase